MHDAASIIIIACLPFSVVAVALGLVCTVCFTPNSFFCLLLIFIWQTNKDILNVYILASDILLWQVCLCSDTEENYLEAFRVGEPVVGYSLRYSTQNYKFIHESAVDKSGGNIQAVCLWWVSEVQIWTGKEGSIIAWCTWGLNTRSLPTPRLSDNWRAN